MSLADELYALRHSAAWSRSEHVSAWRVFGPEAFEAMDHLCPPELYLQDGQFIHTLLLDDAGIPLADVYVGLDDEEFIVLAEGMEPDALARHFAANLPVGTAAEIPRLDDRAILSVNGPFAWEVMAELFDPEVMGLPYSTFFVSGGITCFRGGKTGEYGYDLLVPRNREGEVIARLRELGAAYDMIEAGLEALDHCALENWFFNIRREGRLGVTPLELQLQWRVSYRKEYVGSDALQKLRRSGVRQRLTTVVCSDEIATGDPVEHEGREIGRIVNAGFSAPRGDWVGLAMLDIAWAHSGLGCLAAAHGASIRRLRTVSPPVLFNVSLTVGPQSHSYRKGDGRALKPRASEGT
jgi:glycine cleavage system aminomethyltransferase T